MPPLSFGGAGLLRGRGTTLPDKNQKKRRNSAALQNAALARWSSTEQAVFRKASRGLTPPARRGSAPMLDLIRFTCPKCGTQLRVTSSSQRALLCHRCRSRVGVPVPGLLVRQKDSPPPADPPDPEADDSPAGERKIRLLPTAVAGGLIGLAAIAALWWHLEDQYRAAAVARADEVVAEAVAAAKAHAEKGRWDEAVALLEKAAADELAPRAAEAQAQLGPAREARAVAAAEAAVGRRDFAAAKQILEEHLASPQAAKERAERLAADLALATSDERAAAVLRRLPAEALRRLAEGAAFAELSQVAPGPLRRVYAETLRRHLP